MGSFGMSKTPAVSLGSSPDNDAIKVVADSKTLEVTLLGNWIRNDMLEKTYHASDLRSALEFVGTQLRHEAIANIIDACLTRMAAIFNGSSRHKEQQIVPKYSIDVGDVNIPCKAYPQVAILVDTKNGEIAVGRQASQDTQVEGIRKFGPNKTFDALVHSFQILDGIDSPNCCCYTL
jgi:hypothetical protein